MEVAGQSAEMGDAQSGRNKGRVVSYWAAEAGSSQLRERYGPAGMLSQRSVTVAAQGQFGGCTCLLPRLRPCQVKGYAAFH